MIVSTLVKVNTHARARQHTLCEIERRDRGDEGESTVRGERGEGEGIDSIEDRYE